MIDLTIPKHNLNFGDKIRGQHLDCDIVKKKLAVFSTAFKLGLFKEPVKGHFRNNLGAYNDKLKLWSNAVKLYEDKTIYAYANLKWNGKPIRLYPFQDAIINDLHKRIDVESSNQIGKSFLLCVDAVIEFLQDHGKGYTIGLISKSMAQNSSNMRMVKQMLKTANIEFAAGDSDSMTVTTRDIYKHPEDSEKYLAYSNTLVCAVASTSSLGFPFNLELLDEFEFWENPEGLAYMYDQVFKPRMFDTKGKCVIFSNPNGKNFVSEDLQKRKDLITGLPEFHVYNFNFLDKPGNTQKEWDQEKSNTHPVIFASTVAALRTDVEGAFFTNKEILDSYSKKLDEMGVHAGIGKQCYFFLDVGVVHDQNVLTGLYKELNDKGDTVLNLFYEHYYPVTYPLWRVVGLEPGKDNTFNGEDGWEGYALDNLSVKQVMTKYSFKEVMPVFGVDATGHAAIVPLINSVGLTCQDIIFTGVKKWKMYERFKTFMAKRLLKRGRTANWLHSKNQNWDFQARKLLIKKPQNGSYYLIHHALESDLDDVMDSTAGCVLLADDQATGSIGVDFVGHEKVGVSRDEEFDAEFEEQHQKDRLNRVSSMY